MRKMIKLGKNNEKKQRRKIDNCLFLDYSLYTKQRVRVQWSNRERECLIDHCLCKELKIKKYNTIYIIIYNTILQYVWF